MITAIYYHPDGYETSRPDLMGRHSAGEGMLKAICRYTSSDEIYAYCIDKEHYDHFLEKVTRFSAHPKQCTWVHPYAYQRLKEPGCIFMPDPVLSNMAWLRRHGDMRDFSLCGVTRSTASDRAMDAIGNLLTAPLQPWDALVCTSMSVRTMVQRILLDYHDYLDDRFGFTGKSELPVELPVIPLGVEFAEFDLDEDKKAQHRKDWREKLALTPSDPVILYVGRLSFNEKAHPVPLFIALEQCARRLKQTICLVMAGWFRNETSKVQFIEAARLFCPSVKVAFVDGRDPEVRKTIWYVADLFTSLVDNVQETFGLAPVEAMAAGLPVVVSDWDGFKETVRDGIDGMRISTWTPPAGLGDGMALAYASGAASYGHYLGYQCQMTVVDVIQCAKAFEKLLSDRALRKSMGEAGKERVKSTFDWKVVIKQYEELWNHQNEIRKTCRQIGSQLTGGPSNPLRNDPFTLFAQYSTRRLSPNTFIRKTLEATREKLAAALKNPMAAFGSKYFYPGDKLAQLLDSLSAEKLVSVQSLCARVPGNQGRALLASLLWLGKTGFLQLFPANCLDEIETAAIQDAISPIDAIAPKADCVKSSLLAENTQASAQFENVHSLDFQPSDLGPEQFPSVFCPNCSDLVQIDWAYCHSCGKPLPENSPANPSAQRYNSEAFRSENYGLASAMADHEKFKAVLAEYIQAVTANPQNLLGYRRKLIESYERLSQIQDPDCFGNVLWGALCLASDSYFAEKAMKYGWAAEELGQVLSGWYQLLAHAFLVQPQPLEPQDTNAWINNLISLQDKARETPEN